MEEINGTIRCLVCGNEWDWIDDMSFYGCPVCGSLYVVGAKKKEKEKSPDIGP